MAIGGTHCCCSTFKGPPRPRNSAEKTRVLIAFSSYNARFFFFFVSHFVVFYLYEASTFDICSSFLLLKLSLSSCLYPLYQLSLTFEFPFDSHDPHSEILPSSHVPYHFMTHFSIIFFPLQCLSCIGLSRFLSSFFFSLLLFSILPSYVPYPHLLHLANLPDAGPE